jgi:hypothetical protein
MLNDKSRRGLCHLPASRKWVSLHAGETVRLPASEARGGWGAGHYDFFPWRIESFDCAAESAIVRSLADSRITRRISRRELEHWSENAPFGQLNAMCHRPPFGFIKPRWQRRSRTRYA